MALSGAQWRTENPVKKGVEGGGRVNSRRAARRRDAVLPLIAIPDPLVCGVLTHIIDPPYLWPALEPGIKYTVILLLFFHVNLSENLK